MQMTFDSISEDRPGAKWQAAFCDLWPRYKAWFLRNGGLDGTSLKAAETALRTFMPELMPTYDRLVELVEEDPVAARFLTCFRPPPYLAGCSQMALTKRGMNVLVRNYDLDPARNDGMILRTNWDGTVVIAASEFLWGVADGMNANGLALSLAYGGRRIVGEGFGIPLILRYVLEVCADVREAVEVLRSIPSHMSYNITLLDRTGIARTVQVAPDRSLKICDLAIATNHQGVPENPAHARFTKTLERDAFLRALSTRTNLSAHTLIDCFLRNPLYSSRYDEGFGTLYTVAYFPTTGVAEYRWPDSGFSQSFTKFVDRSDVVPLLRRPVPAKGAKGAWVDTNLALSNALPPPRLFADFAPAWNAYTDWSKSAHWIEIGAQIARHYSVARVAD